MLDSFGHLEKVIPHPDCRVGRCSKSSCTVVYTPVSPLRPPCTPGAYDTFSRCPVVIDALAEQEKDLRIGFICPYMTCRDLTRDCCGVDAIFRSDIENMHVGCDKISEEIEIIPGPGFLFKKYIYCYIIQVSMRTYGYIVSGGDVPAVSGFSGSCFVITHYRFMIMP